MMEEKGMLRVSCKYVYGVEEGGLLMKQSILMRFLLCKIHSPFMCFCKPSAEARLYGSCSPFKLENGFVPSTDDFAVSDKSSSEGVNDDEIVLKSCIRKNNPSRPVPIKEIVKKRVQWIDSLGKELAEIKEFEASTVVLVRQGILTMKRKVEVVSA